VARIQTIPFSDCSGFGKKLIEYHEIENQWTKYILVFARYPYVVEIVLEWTAIFIKVFI